MNYRPYLAELLGTFLLALLVRVSVGMTLPIATPIIAALTLGFVVYTLGPVSGAHINPAVTLALYSVRKISRNEAGKYILAQVIGAALAILLAKQLPLGALSATPNIPAGFFGEVLGAAVFLVGIASVVSRKSPESLSGIVVGWSLLLGILMAVGIGSAGILNPAVALILGSLSFNYIVGPIVGAIAGVWLYRAIAE